MNYWMVGLAIVSGASLFSLIATIRGVFAYIEAVKKEKPDLCSLNEYLSCKKYRSLLALAGLFACSYQGIYILLFWMPESWSVRYDGFSVHGQLALWGSVIFIVYTLVFLSNLSEVLRRARH